MRQNVWFWVRPNQFVYILRPLLQRHTIGLMFVWICLLQGWQVLYIEVLEKDWKEKHDDWLKRFKGLSSLVDWFFVLCSDLYVQRHFNFLKFFPHFSQIAKMVWWETRQKSRWPRLPRRWGGGRSWSTSKLIFYLLYYFTSLLIASFTS